VIQILLRFYFECFALPIKAQPLSYAFQIKDFNSAALYQGKEKK